MESAGNRSVMSRDMEELTQGKEHVSAQIRGHKANLSNPNTSEASKENSKKTIESLGGDDNMVGSQDDPKSKHAAKVLEGSRAL